MAGSLALTFDILARDRASKEFNNVGDAVDKTGKRGADFGKKFGVAVAAGFAVAAAAAFKFGKDSVAAYVEAEQSSVRLDEALKKFPATADRSRESFDKLNTALAQKTKFDDDATASGQAVLAQFKLTGKQVQDLTPLLQDYAAKTGKDLPDAANTLGKALLGKGKALAEVGIKFKDAGSVGKNFDQIMGGLRTQVGGFATAEGKTAAGQAAIMRNQFGELQEKVGGALVPVLLKLAEKVQGVIAEFKNGTGVGGQFRDAFDKIKKSIDENRPAIDAVVKAIGQLAVVFLTQIIPAIVTFVSNTMPLLVGAFKAGANAGATAFGLLLSGLNAIFSALAKVPGPFQDNFRAAAAATEAAKNKVDALKIAINAVPPNKAVTVSAATERAKTDINSVGAAVARLNDKTITVTTIQRTVYEAQRDGKGGGVQARALGGPVTAGRPYLVGERGPELIVPSQSGNVLTAGQTQQALAGATYNITTTATDPAQLVSLLRRMEALNA